MPYDGVQQFRQTERYVGTVVRVRVRSSPFFKAGQNLLYITELVLDVRKQFLGPQQNIICRGEQGGKEKESDKSNKGIRVEI